MSRKPKRVTFKKGDEVIYLDGRYYHGRTTVTEATVTAVRSVEDYQIVHTKHFDCHNNEWRRAFTSGPSGMFQENPYPIWQLILHPGKKAVASIRKRLEKANKKREAWRAQCDEIHRDVESDARKWRDAEESRRLAKVPNMQHHMDRVISRAGFKHPKRN